MTSLSLSHEDLVSRWSLSFSDMEFVTGKPVSERLGLAAQLKFFMTYGFFVQDRSAIPADGISYLAEQLGFDDDTRANTILVVVPRAGIAPRYCSISAFGG